LAVLFLGSVTTVHATRFDSFKWPEKKSHSHLSKFEQIKLKSFLRKKELKQKNHTSFLELIKKEEPNGKKMNVFKNLIGQNSKHIKFNRDYKCRTPNSVPEPSSMLLLGFGLIGLAGWGRKKLKKNS